MAEDNESIKALRGKSGRMFDLMFRTLTPRQFSGWLRDPLEQAAAHGDEALAEMLVDAGAEIGDALHNAVRGGHTGIAHNLLEKGAPVNTWDVNGDTLLHVACQCSDPNTIASLLGKGARINEFNREGTTPLYLAAQIGQEAAARALLNAGADINIRGGELRGSAMHAAARGGHVAVLRLLVAFEADVEYFNAEGDTPLHIAVLASEVGAVRALVEVGADVNARNNAHTTPLRLAALTTFHNATRSLLLDADDDDEEEDDFQAGTPRYRGAEMVDLLLRSGADETLVHDSDFSAGSITSQVDGIADAITGAVRPVLEDLGRMSRLLASAPVDRAWRRRGLLVLYRSHPTRVQLKQEDSQSDAPLARRSRSHTNKTRTEVAGVGVQSASTSGVNEREAGKAKDGGCDNWTGLVAKVLGLAEEEVFRTIVGYL